MNERKEEIRENLEMKKLARGEQPPRILYFVSRKQIDPCVGFYVSYEFALQRWKYSGKREPYQAGRRKGTPE